MKPKFYILKDRQVVPSTLEEWAAFFGSDDRVVAVDAFPVRVTVSTVFLGIDHGWTDEGRPIVFETMVFGGPLDQHQERCATWREAKAQHERVCAMVRARVLQ